MKIGAEKGQRETKSRQLISQENPGCTPHRREQGFGPLSPWGQERQFNLVNKGGIRKTGKKTGMGKHKMVMKQFPLMRAVPRRGHMDVVLWEQT